MIYAVIDTNVLVSALLTSKSDTATVQVIEAFLNGQIIPLYNEEIINEYEMVLNRPAFHFSEEKVNLYIGSIRQKGLLASRIPSNFEFPDSDDAVFYEVALSKEDAYVITGNLKHFPKTPIVVTPAEMIAILSENVTQ
jgi:putative PIN family toxin of toxin-antitoxin system